MKTEILSMQMINNYRSLLQAYVLKKIELLWENLFIVIKERK